MNLMGEYPVAIDNKGRLRMPAALLRQFPAPTLGADGTARYEFVLNRGFEQCITLYPKEAWNKIVAKLANLNQFNTTHRRFVRTFFLGVSAVEIDSADRILLQKPLMEHAGITDEAIMVAMHDRVEIWSPQRHAELLAIPSDDFAELAQLSLGGGLEVYEPDTKPGSASDE